MLTSTHIARMFKKTGQHTLTNCIFQVRGRGVCGCPVDGGFVSILYDCELVGEETVTWAVVCFVCRIILLIKSNCSRVKPSPSRLPLLSVKVMVAPGGPEEILLVDDMDDVVEVGDNSVTPVFSGTFKAFSSSSVNAKPVAASTTVPPFERYAPKQVAPSGELASPVPK